MLPLAIFTLLFFVLPVGLFLTRAIDNSEVPAALPRTVSIIGQWNGEGLPQDEVLAALVADLSAADRQTVAMLGRRLNFQQAGYRTLISRTATALGRSGDADESARERLAAIDPAWATTAPWRLIRSEAWPVTSLYILSAVDLRWEDGFVAAPDGARIYIDVITRTFVISGLVTLCCLLIGFPFARLLAAMSSGTANLLMLFVLMPFWTSVVIRSLAWIMLFQSQGPVNAGLEWLTVIDQPPELIFNRFGVVVAMTHVLLPFMIFPLHATMRTIPANYVRAAAALGASPVRAFIDVYLPLVAPGVVAGCLLVFIMALGYYVTPALVGGPGDQMLSYFIAFNVGQTVNWGLAAALGLLLLGCVGIVYLVYTLVLGSARRHAA